MWALIAITGLLLPVGLMTYAIMYVPARDDGSSLLTQHDIEDYVGLCTLIRNESGDGALKPGKRIMELFAQQDPDSVGSIVIEAARSNKFQEEKKEVFVRALNGVLARQDFYKAQYFEHIVGAEKSIKYYQKRKGKRKNSEAVHRANRRLLEAAYPNEFIRMSKPRPVRVQFHRFIENLKLGAASVPFWALMFFFTIFLVVTYLFGFAFAFHDKKTLQTTKTPALHMTKPYRFETGGQQSQALPISSPEQENSSGQSDEYRFYFDSPAAIPKYKFTPFRQADYRKVEEERKSKEWGERKNFEHVPAMIDGIERAGKKGTGVRITLNGRADDGSLKDGAPYSSNYELSEARAQVLREIIQGELRRRQKDKIPLEWNILPLSSEPDSLSMYQSEGDLQQTEQSTQIADIREKVDALKEKLDQDEALEDLKKQGLKLRLVQIGNLRVRGGETLPVQKKLLKAMDELIKAEKKAEDLPKQVAKLAQTEGISEEYKQAQRKLLEEEIEKTKRLIQFKDEEIQEGIYLDEPAKKRVVTALLEPIQANHDFYSLSLMDYMYFTIYTITNTGYGDVAPITVYAKFMCSIANILEVFFLVVFFNALLSVKREKA